MINFNHTIQKDGGFYFVRIPSTHYNELEPLINKHKGMVHIQIGRPVSSKTEAQNNALHALIENWYFTFCHSAPDWVTSKALFKEWCKKEYGKAIYTNRGRQVCCFLPSVSIYTKQELSEFIDKLKQDIEASGALAHPGQYGKKLNEIFAGMEELAKMR